MDGKKLPILVVNDEVADLMSSNPVDGEAFTYPETVALLLELGREIAARCETVTEPTARPVT